MTGVSAWSAGWPGPATADATRRDGDAWDVEVVDYHH